MVHCHGLGPFSWSILMVHNEIEGHVLLVSGYRFLLVHLFRAQESQVAPRQSASKRERDETDDFLRPTHHPLACHVGTQAGTYAWIGSGVRGLRSTGRIRQGNVCFPCALWGVVVLGRYRPDRLCPGRDLPSFVN